MWIKKLKSDFIVTIFKQKTRGKLRFFVFSISKIIQANNISITWLLLYNIYYIKKIKITIKKLLTNMKKEENPLLLEQIIKRLEEIQEAEIISRKIAKILFQLILAATLYLSYCFISLSLDRNAFIQNYRPALILLIAAVSIGINQNISRYRQKKRLQRFPVSEIRIMIEMKKVPDLLISLGDENSEDSVIRENSYDKRALRILVFIFMLIESKYILEILDRRSRPYICSRGSKRSSRLWDRNSWRWTKKPVSPRTFSIRRILCKPLITNRELKVLHKAQQQRPDSQLEFRFFALF